MFRIEAGDPARYAGWQLGDKFKLNFKLQGRMVMRFLTLSLALLLGACSYDGGFKLPGVYRIDIQQGSIIQQEMLSRLKPGMDKNQVRFVMGTPSLVDPFHADRWEYLYIYSDGGRTRKQRHITLHFKDDKLAYVDGDVVPGATRADDLVIRKTKTVDVPADAFKQRRGLARVLDALPFMGKEEPPPGILPDGDPTQAEATDADATETTNDTDAPMASDATATDAGTSGDE